MPSEGTLERRIVRETDLAEPVCEFLRENGYDVRSEVGGCDITAVRGDELVVVELKRTLSTGLLVQATQRQRIADSVYVAVPVPSDGVMTRRFRQLCHLVKRLELGLIVVTPSPIAPRMDVLFHPLPFERKRDSKKRRAILTEIAGRSGDFNRGGSTKLPLVTAYREECIHVACCLERFGSLSPKQIIECGASPKAQSILAHNHYRWFDRVDRGSYALTNAGREALALYARIAEAYRTKLDEQFPKRRRRSTA